jgi:hypothetical protein
MTQKVATIQDSIANWIVELHAFENCEKNLKLWFYEIWDIEIEL